MPAGMPGQQHLQQSADDRLQIHVQAAGIFQVRVAVSGARGFVGSRLLPALSNAGHDAIALLRTSSGSSSDVVIGDLACDGPMRLPPIEAVVHLAARVHVMYEHEQDPLVAYRQVNVHGTQRLLEAALYAGARRFVFVSTIKVLGDETLPGAPFTQDVAPRPLDPYGISKLEAEHKVIEFCDKHSIEWAIIRPVLTFGAGVGGNFAQLLHLVDRQLPLPFGAIRNARSLLHVDNLGAFLTVAVDHPYLSNRAVNLADEPAHSTPELVRALAASMGRRVRLVAVPSPILEGAGALLRRSGAVRRLTRSLQVDTGPLFREMRWRPPLSWTEALQETVTNVFWRH
jgi:UDP-glucose 4-epimerase